MADKEQIMINGVDVRECKYLTYQLEEDGQYYWFCKISPTGGPDECECNPECFYKRVLKQLARKTQEYERLKKYFFKQNEWLQQRAKECEDLKEEKEVIKKYLGISDKSIMQRLEELTEYKLKRQLKYIKIQEENDRYRKALEEIEKICLEDVHTFADVTQLRYDSLDKILDIINKVKGERITKED